MHRMITKCKINDYHITEEIGSGAYGLVYKAVHYRGDILDLDEHSNLKEYAIKATMKKLSKAERIRLGLSNVSQNFQAVILDCFRRNHYVLSLPEVDLESIKSLSEEELSKISQYKEIALHLKVHDHKNIVTIYKVLESPVATFIVMDYYKIDLFTSIVDMRHFQANGRLIKKVFLQICSAIEYCHKNGIFHCDIKPENMLLDSDDNVHLCDFGLATTAPYLTPNVCIGSSYYMAPERISYSDDTEAFEESEYEQDNEDSKSFHIDYENGNTNKNHNEKTTISTAYNNRHSKGYLSFSTASADVWSLGIILINLSCVRNPWLKAHQTDDNTFYYYVKDPKVLLKILPISQEFFRLLKRILKVDPSRRISIQNLMLSVKSIKSFTEAGPLSTVEELSNEDYDYYTNYFDSVGANTKSQLKPLLHNRASSSYLDSGDHMPSKRMDVEHSPNNIHPSKNTIVIPESPKLNEIADDENENDDMRREGSFIEHKNFKHSEIINQASRPKTDENPLPEFQERLKYLKMDLSSINR